MHALQAEENINKITSMIEIYEELANKRATTGAELEASKAEMRLIKENILSLIIETKKGLKRMGARMRP